jgi:hypothetical protein
VESPPSRRMHMFGLGAQLIGDHGPKGPKSA